VIEQAPHVHLASDIVQTQFDQWNTFVHQFLVFRHHLLVSTAADTDANHPLPFLSHGFEIRAVGTLGHSRSQSVPGRQFGTPDSNQSNHLSISCPVRPSYGRAAPPFPAGSGRISQPGEKKHPNSPKNEAIEENCGSG
jgi:hypothetical protein